MTEQKTESVAFKTTTEEAKELLERALKTERRLARYGIGVFNERLYGRTADGAVERAKKFESDRASLAGPYALKEIAASADWIKQHEPKHFRGHTSYRLKHCVEEWFHERKEYVYVANGSFIAAAIGLGLKHVVSPGSPNVTFRFKRGAKGLIGAQVQTA